MKVSSYLSSEEIKSSSEFLERGYIIRKIKNPKNFSNIKEKIVKDSKKILNFGDKSFSLNYAHKYLSSKNLNSFRVSLMNSLNKSNQFKKNYFEAAKYDLFNLVGNELAMQKRINLSIQLPKDESSLLPVHSDVWSGDSPYEVVVWMPLVDCYKTKSMYILPPSKYKSHLKNFSKMKKKDSTSLFNTIKKDVEFLKINEGEILIFNQALPHGNIVNQEQETRWSMNCRFKSLFSPYGDKKLGEFFVPITTKVATTIGMNYSYPDL